MTLIEILLATFILALGLVGIMSMVPAVVRQARGTLQTTQGASVAQNARASLVRQRLDLYSSEYGTGIDTAIDLSAGTYTNDHLRIGSHPLEHHGLDDTDVDNLTILPDYRYENDEGETFVLSVPRGFEEDEPYAWTALVNFRPDPDVSENPYYAIELYVYFPAPYGGARTVYRTSFVMRRIN